MPEDKDDRIPLTTYVPAADVARFNRAAALCGISTMSTFLRQAACEKANRLEEEEAIRQARVRNAETPR